MSALETVKARCIEACETDPLRPVELDALTLLSFVEAFEALMRSAQLGLDAAAARTAAKASPTPDQNPLILTARLAAAEASRAQFEAALQLLAKGAVAQQDRRFADAVLAGLRVEDAAKAAA